MNFNLDTLISVVLPILQALHLIVPILYGVLSLYILWIFYLAVMNLARAKDAGTLTKIATVLGTPILLVGYVIDFLVNVFVMTVILVELPKETTVTARLKRHNEESSGWRKAVAVWFAVNLLDAFDPSGKHI